MEDEDSCTISNGEKSLAPENEGFTTCLSAATICIQEITNSKEDSLYNMVEEDVQCCPNKEMDPKYQDYIERWFQSIFTSKHYSLLQKLFVSYHLQLLVLHALVYCKIFISNLSMNVCVSLLRTWLHSKDSYT